MDECCYFAHLYLVKSSFNCKSWLRLRLSLEYLCCINLERFAASTSVTRFCEMNHSCLHQLTLMSLLLRWWSWRCRDWSLWLPTGLSTAPWRWREARNSRPTRQRHPNQREHLSLHPPAKKLEPRWRVSDVPPPFKRFCMKFFMHAFLHEAKLIF